MSPVEKSCGGSAGDEVKVCAVPSCSTFPGQAMLPEPKRHAKWRAGLKLDVR